MTIETKLIQAITHRWEKTGVILDNQKFVIGVSPKGWREIGGDEETKTIEFLCYGKRFKVSPLPGLPDESVALIWQ